MKEIRIVTTEKGGAEVYVDGTPLECLTYFNIEIEAGSVPVMRIEQHCRESSNIKRCKCEQSKK